MELIVHFIQVNSQFNQTMADNIHGGEESEDNIKYLWEDELKVAEAVTDFKINNNATYVLAGYFPNDAPFNFNIAEMVVCDCNLLSGKNTHFAVSKKLVKKTDRIVDAQKGETHLYFYLKDKLEMENPMDGVYILKENFPKELLGIG